MRLAWDAFLDLELCRTHIDLHKQHTVWLACLSHSSWRRSVRFIRSLYTHSSRLDGSNEPVWVRDTSADWLIADNGVCNACVCETLASLWMFFIKEIWSNERWNERGGMPLLASYITSNDYYCKRLKLHFRKLKQHSWKNKIVNDI